MMQSTPTHTAQSRTLRLFLALTCLLVAMVPLAHASQRHGPYSLEVTDAGGHPLRTFERGGRTFVLGEQGQRYRIRVRNHSAESVEAVISVDGRDALDGQTARSDKPGYLVAPWGEVTVDGFRLSLQDVATFRFSPVAQSYAAQMGNDRQVGVIGVAVFRPRPAPPPRPVRQQPRYEEDAPCDMGGAADEKSAAKGVAPSAAPGRGGNMGGAGARDRSVARESAERPGLGTAFGERRSSQVVHVQFERANPHRPDALLAVNYNDRDGLLAMGIDLRPPRPQPTWWELQRRAQAEPFTDVSRDFAAPPPGWDDRRSR